MSDIEVSSPCVPVEHRPYLLLSRLARALSHQIRTPLNVINNDLIYFKRFIENNECERGIKRCEQITRLLHTLNLLGNVDGPLSQVDLQDVLGNITDKHEFTPSNNSEERFPICGNAVQLTKLLDNLLQLLKNHSWLDQQYSTQISLYKLSCNSLVLIHLQKSLSELPVYSKTASAKDSLAELFSSLLSSQSIIPPLLDAILWNHQANTHWYVDDAVLNIRLSFPLTES